MNERRQYERDLHIFRKKRREKTGADFTKERNAKKEQKKAKEIRVAGGRGTSGRSLMGFRSRLLAWNRAANLARMSPVSRKRGTIPKEVLHSSGMRSLRMAHK